MVVAIQPILFRISVLSGRMVNFRQLFAHHFFPSEPEPLVILAN